jgi:hypothetical protein
MIKARVLFSSALTVIGQAMAEFGKIHIGGFYSVIEICRQATEMAWWMRLDSKKSRTIVRIPVQIDT